MTKLFPLGRFPERIFSSDIRVLSPLGKCNRAMRRCPGRHMLIPSVQPYCCFETEVSSGQCISLRSARSISSSRRRFWLSTEYHAAPTLPESQEHLWRPDILDQQTNTMAHAQSTVVRGTSFVGAQYAPATRGRSPPH